VSNSPRRTLRSRLLSLAGTLLRIAIVVGVILHLTVRDAIPGVAIVYYALPRAVLAGLAVCVAIADLLHQQRREASLWGAAALGIVAWSLIVDWRFNSSPEHAGGIRVMYWNACRGYGGWDAVINEVRAQHPDVVALGETQQRSSEFRALWRRELPEYDISFLGAGMVCLVRGSSSESRVRDLDGYSHARELDVVIDGAELRCLIVDVYAHPLYDRRRALTAIAATAEISADQPLLILGDFNTPTDSVHFADLRRHHVNAFEQAGYGCLATWPTFAPVLSLDQVWVNSYLKIEDVRHPWTTVSDHRPVVLTAIPTAASPASRISGN
jgi:endonuclease/exonuclease/phosphatase (EEP) superfamily protein YafD